jgi:hypothetical protein
LARSGNDGVGLLLHFADKRCISTVAGTETAFNDDWLLTEPFIWDVESNPPFVE